MTLICLCIDIPPCPLPTAKYDTNITAPLPLTQTRKTEILSYVDCASNAVVQTTAMAHPATPASELYKMARIIEANINSSWINNKTFPT